MFDAEPYKSDEYMSEAVLRGHADHVVSYFVPTDATLEKRRKDEEEGRDYIWEEEYEYIKTHEYNCKITNTHTHNKKELIENYFFIWRDNEVVYNELETRINLTKRRMKQTPQGVSLLAIKHRDLNETENNCFLNRLEKIEPKKKKEEIEAEEKAKAKLGEEQEGEDEQKEEDEDESQESVNSDEKSSSEKDDKSDDSEEESSDSESEVYRKKSIDQHSKSRAPTRKPVVKSDSDKSSSAASSAASGSSSSSSESEDDRGASSSASSDESGGRQREQKSSKKKLNEDDVNRIFGSDSD